MCVCLYLVIVLCIFFIIFFLECGFTLFSWFGEVLLSYWNFVFVLFLRNNYYWVDREGRGPVTWGGEKYDQNTFEIVLNIKNTIKFNKFLSSLGCKTKKEWINIKIIYIATYLPLYWFYKKRVLIIYRIILLTKIQISNFRLKSHLHFYVGFSVIDKWILKDKYLKKIILLHSSKK